MGELKHCETPIHILLGGGIGSGKSAAGRRFEGLGAMVVEADRVGHAVLEPGGEAFGPVGERWPSVIADGFIDRTALAEIVFADPEQLRALEALTHPPIIRRISEIASSEDDLVVEIPLVLEMPGDWTRVFVDAANGTRVRRAVERGGSESAVNARMMSQPKHDEWLAWADHQINNDGSIEDFEKQIDALWQGLKTTHCGLQV